MVKRDCVFSGCSFCSRPVSVAGLAGRARQVAFAPASVRRVSTVPQQGFSIN